MTVVFAYGEANIISKSRFPGDSEASFWWLQGRRRQWRRPFEMVGLNQRKIVSYVVPEKFQSCQVLSCVVSIIMIAIFIMMMTKRQSGFQLSLFALQAWWILAS